MEGARAPTVTPFAGVTPQYTMSMSESCMYFHVGESTLVERVRRPNASILRLYPPTIWSGRRLGATRPAAPVHTTDVPERR